MSFGAPEWFWGLLVLPLLLLLYLRSESKGIERLREFVSPRLIPRLAGTVNRFRRAVRFALQLVALALALVALAKPRWGYTFEEAHRKGLDIIIAVDTSRSMLANDVQPNRLQRVKLSTQDLINTLQGDRVGLIAFAGSAFVQAPLTIDYDAVIEAITDLDTKTIPEGGTNISAAVGLAQETFGKSATGNRALIIFTDGEELNGDAVATAKKAAEGGVRIFTVGVGTPEGSLIPLTGAESNFVKDAKGQVVKSRLDEKRLREIAEATGGFYLHLEPGLRTAQQLINDGLGKMQAGDIDARMSRRPIERYEWPLGAALFSLAMSILIRERKRARVSVTRPAQMAKLVTASAAALLTISATSAEGAAPGMDFYQRGQFPEAYQQFQETLQSHPETPATDKLQFDAGAAAYKMRDYNKALQAFSQALLSPDRGLQSSSHYNLGNTLYQQGDQQKGDERKLADWNNALQHYQETLKLDPNNQEAKDNADYVKRKIEELKQRKQQQPSPTPTPSPQKKQNKQDKNQDQQKNQQQQQQQQQQNQKDQQNQDQQQQQQQQDQQQNQQQQQQQDQPGSGQNQNQEQQQRDQSQAKNEQQKNQQDQPGQSPSPSPPEKNKTSSSPSPSPNQSENPDQQSRDAMNQSHPSPSPSPSAGENEPSPSPSASDNQNEQGEGESPTPSASPRKKMAGDVKGAAGGTPDKPPADQQQAQAEPEKEGEMNEKQAEALLQSMKDEEARVQLDERRARHRVYNDW